MKPEIYRLGYLGSPVYGSAFHGAEYDFSSACPVCLAGAKRIGPVLIDSREVRSRHFVETGNHEWVVSQLMKNSIENQSLVGITFALARDITRSESKRGDLYECLVQSELPKFSSQAHVERSEVCSRCKRGCYSGLLGDKTELAYEANGIDSTQDFYLTWEQFGGTIKRTPLSRSVIPLPVLVVSARAKAVLKEQAGRLIAFDRVRITVNSTRQP